MEKHSNGQLTERSFAHSNETELLPSVKGKSQLSGHHQHL